MATQKFQTVQQLISAMKFLKPYFIQYRLKFIMAIILMFVVAGATASYAYLVKEVLDKIFIEKDSKMLMIIPIVMTVISTSVVIAMLRVMVLVVYDEDADVDGDGERDGERARTRRDVAAHAFFFSPHV